MDQGPSSLVPTDEQVTAYRRDGWVHVPGLLTAEEVAHFAAPARRLLLEQARADRIAGTYRPIFIQCLNVWQRNPVLRSLTLHPRIAAVATGLAGMPLRLFHDNLLGKAPSSAPPTEWHQDQPFWPFADGAHGLTAWIALMDIPQERGCMAFLPGQHHRELPMQDVNRAASLFQQAPELAEVPPETQPMAAGDVTFHHGRTPHRAHANTSDQLRMAQLVIYTGRDTRYDPEPGDIALDHIITRGLGLRPGDAFDDEAFPPVPLVE